MIIIQGRERERKQGQGCRGWVLLLHSVLTHEMGRWTLDRLARCSSPTIYRPVCRPPSPLVLSRDESYLRRWGQLSKPANLLLCYPTHHSLRSFSPRHYGPTLCTRSFPVLCFLQRLACRLYSQSGAFLAKLDNQPECRHLQGLAMQRRVSSCSDLCNYWPSGQAITPRLMNIFQPFTQSWASERNGNAWSFIQTDILVFSSPSGENAL